MSLLGIDLGTTGIKCAVYNEDGRLLGKTYREFVLYTPEPGIVELDPNIVWKTLCDNIRELNSNNEVKKDPISALGMSVSGCEAIPIDRDGNALYNAIMSMDKRGKEENDWIISKIGIVRYSEGEVLESANLAVDIGFDYLMGTLYYDSIWDVIDGKIKYLPFCGKVFDHPSILAGTIDEIISDAERLESKGVDGFDLLAYRYTNQDEVSALIEKLKEAVSVPIVSAGSINSFERLQKTLDSGIWAFTIGGAFFEKKFVQGGSFRENVEAVYEKLKT